MSVIFPLLFSMLTDYEAVTLHKRLESLSPRGPAGLDADERLTLAYLAAINRRRSKTTTGGTVGSTTPAARRAKRSAAG